MISNDISVKESGAPDPHHPPENSLAGFIIEWGSIFFVVCLLYKLEYMGAGILVAIATMGLSGVRNMRFPATPTAIWSILYVLLATATAFQVSIDEGVYRTAQGLLVLISGIAISSHFAKLPRHRIDSFLFRLLVVLTCVLVHIIVHHIRIGRYVDWKTLWGTKFVFSLLPVLFFFHENRLRKKLSTIGWWFLTGALALLILLSGERKAYFLFPVLFLFSNAKLVSKIITVAAAISALTLFVSYSSGDFYVKKQILSFFESHKDVSTVEFYANQNLAFDSNLTREFVNRTAKQEFFKRPFFGMGATGYHAWAQKTYGNENPGLATNVHGEINRVPVENGLLGIGIVLAYLFCVVRRTLLCLKKKKTSQDSSEAKLPLYLLLFLLPYLATEAINTLMMEVILLSGFYANSLGRARRATPSLSLYQGPKNMVATD
ncbi:MAG: hypothetical protein PHW76_06775 [Alphaproteobacteria bacterium]|nr:hypothetical protein [Alphaproteobacteria bacterium]